MMLTEKQLMELAARRIEELLEDVSHACGDIPAYDFGTFNLIRDLRKAAQS